MIRLLIGSIISFGALYLALIWMGGRPVLYLHPPEIMVLLFAPVGLTISSFGAKRCYRTLLCVLGFESSDASDRVVLKRWISSTYAVGWLVFMGGVILTLARMDQHIMVLGANFSAALTAPMVAIVISEFFLRPALNRIEDAFANGSQ